MTAKKYEYRKLRGRIVEKYSSIRKFSEETGLSLTSMSLKLNNKVGFSQEDIEQWANLLEIPKEEYWTYFFT